MGIIAIIIVLFIVKKLIALLLSIIGSILTVCSEPGRTQRIKQTKPERNGTERTANTELERIRLEREKLRLEYDKQRIETMKENARYTRFEYSEQRINDDKLAKVISDAIGHRLSHYDIEKIRKVCDITIKA